jgi:hypothetical protein
MLRSIDLLGTEVRPKLETEAAAIA